MKRSYLLLPPALFLAGCASPPEGDFPSLSKRPYEDQPAAPPQNPAPAPPQQLPAQLAAQVETLERRVEKSAAAFQAMLPRTRNVANNARGASANSERWVGAHTQLSRLDKSRTDGIAALAEMDRLVSIERDRQIAGNGPAYSPPLTSRQQNMADIIQSQNVIIDSLSDIVGL